MDMPTDWVQQASNHPESVRNTAKHSNTYLPTIMASTSSINSNSSGSQAPNPPPRIHSRPNQPPPPPPLPTVPPVPPPRDSSIAISEYTYSFSTLVTTRLKQIYLIDPFLIAQSTINSRASGNSIDNTIQHSESQLGAPYNPVNKTGERFLAKFDCMFKSLSELPLPDPFMNKPKFYFSQKAQQKHHNHNHQHHQQQPQHQITSPKIHS